ncbi:MULTISPECIES: DsbA family protein [unclassified Microcella]|uniref:DsbA family oxidoreductase n=1 Tax=unclassified Microcella TaxID=2630066 RepID=UPI0006FAA431|nr:MULTISPECIES: DsbA family oxidoreductase [unclassified Microcella]KQV24885.1 disulfide bond formation protein DsbA [Yonghaparkia sp. Root332]KRF31168.1 disulfide bond formation protein DsbA [Yonghaparkia sp. Soil809]
MSNPIDVQIWSDVQCPWCYIGKRKFEAAVADFEAAGGQVEVTYRSFELAPDTPVDFEGTPIDYLSQRKGISPEQAQQMVDRVSGIAESVGLDYHYDRIHQTNTVLAHEMLHFAKAQGKQVELKERLLLAYFTEGRHIGRADELADLAADVGLDRDAAAAALAEHTYLPDVKADMAQAVAYGIQGVPFFVIDARYGISGAQDSTTFLAALQQAAGERSTAGAETS